MGRGETGMVIKTQEAVYLGVTAETSQHFCEFEETHALPDFLCKAHGIGSRFEAVSGAVKRTASNIRCLTKFTSANSDVSNKVTVHTETQTTKTNETILTWLPFFRPPARSSQIGFPPLTPEE